MSPNNRGHERPSLQIARMANSYHTRIMNYMDGSGHVSMNRGGSNANATHYLSNIFNAYLNIQQRRREVSGFRTYTDTFSNNLTNMNSLVDYQ